MSISGWLRPLHYGSPATEISAVRNSVGLFDLHPMSRHLIEGPDALAFIQLLVTNDVKRAVSKSVAQYTCLCDEHGGIIDDVLVFPMSSSKFLLTSSVAAAKSLGSWMYRWAKESDLNVKLLDISSLQTQFSLQGPNSLQLIRREFGPKVAALKHMQFVQADLNGISVFLARVGYTGECGFEFFTDADSSENLWKYLLTSGADFGIAPFGIIAAQTLRIEKGYVLNGVDMSIHNTPYEIGLDWTVCTDKENFLGRDELLRKKAGGVKRHLRRFYIDGADVVPNGVAIYVQEREVGRVTSCCNSQTLGRVIGMGLIDASVNESRPAHIKRGDQVLPVSFVDRAFYDPDGTKLKVTHPEEDVVG